MRRLIVFCIFILSCATHFSFQDAERIGSIDAYYRFIVENPDSPDVEIARSRIQDMLFAEALRKRDVLLIKRYISEFPQDGRTKNLKEILDEIRFENARKSGTKEALELYLIENPDGKYRTEAKKMLQEIEFSRLIDKGDVYEIEQFLSRNKDYVNSQKLMERLESLYLSRISKGDFEQAGRFLTRFPDSKRRFEVLNIIFDAIVDLAENYCIIPNIEGFISSLKKEGCPSNIIEDFKSRFERVRSNCYRLSTFIENPDKYSVTTKGGKMLINKGISRQDRALLMTYLKKYQSSNLQRVSLLTELDSMIPAKSISALKKLMNYPLAFDQISAMINRFFNSTIYERLEIYESIKKLTAYDINRKVVEVFFFLNRDKALYNSIREILFPEFKGYEEINTFLNSSYASSKEDIVLQYLIISIAYNEGQNSFIKGVFREHIRSLFSKVSEVQSMCSEDCPQNIIFDLKGIERIMTDDERYASTIFGDDSDICKIISEKRKEIFSLIQRRDAGQMDVKYEEFTKDVDIDKIVPFVDKEVFKILFKGETDSKRRERIREIIQSKRG